MFKSTLRDEVIKLRALKRQEESDFCKRQQEHRAEVDRANFGASEEGHCRRFHTDCDGRGNQRKRTATNASPGTTVKVPVGRIWTTGGSLTLECEVSADREASLTIFAQAAMRECWGCFAG